MPAGMARVAVKFHIDADGVLTVSARELGTGTSAVVEIQPLHGLTDAEVEAMLAEGFAHAREDFDERRVADLKVEIGTMLRATEKNLNAGRAGLDRESVRDLEEAMQRAKQTCAGSDIRELQKARDE